MEVREVSWPASTSTSGLWRARFILWPTGSWSASLPRSSSSRGLRSSSLPLLLSSFKEGGSLKPSNPRLTLRTVSMHSGDSAALGVGEIPKTFNCTKLMKVKFFLC